MLLFVHIFMLPEGMRIGEVIVHWFFDEDFILATLSCRCTPVDPHLVLPLLLRLRTVVLPFVVFGF